MRLRRIFSAALSAAIGLAAVGCRTEKRVGGAGADAPRSIESRPNPIADKLPQPVDDAPRVRRTLKLPQPQKAVRADEQTRTRLDDGSRDWAVIAATYKSFIAARNRANQLKSSYRECACSVYPGEGEGQNYYVVVGSGMSRENADQTREQAVGAGLPQDTYVTKLAVEKP